MNCSNPKAVALFSSVIVTSLFRAENMLAERQVRMGYLLLHESRDTNVLLSDKTMQHASAVCTWPDGEHGDYYPIMGSCSIMCQHMMGSVRVQGPQLGQGASAQALSPSSTTMAYQTTMLAPKTNLANPLPC